VQLATLGSTADEVAAALAALGAGVTEVVGRPGIDSEELRAATPHWEERVASFELLSSMAPWSDYGLEPIGYRALGRAMAV